MLTSLFLLLFCGLLAWLLARFPLKNAQTPADYRKLLPFFIALPGFLLFNALLAFQGARSLSASLADPPLSTLSAMAGAKSGDGIMLGGMVSAQNDTLTGDYVAYVDEEHLWSPMELWLDLDDGRLAISNDTYQAANWPVDAMRYSYLQAGQPVIVVGRAENWVGLVDDETSQTIRAEIVYAGTYDAFAARARLQRIPAIGLLLANLLAMLLILLLPLRDCLAGLKPKNP